MNLTYQMLPFRMHLCSTRMATTLRKSLLKIMEMSEAKELAEYDMMED